MNAVIRILGIETSGPVCGVAALVVRRSSLKGLSEVLRNGRVVELEHVSEFSRHSEAIHDLLSAVLKRAQMRLDTLDALAVSLGPGSFTGLRVGLAVAKVFSRFGGIPLVPIPTLEAQVAQAAMSGGFGRYVATIDAKRGEVYAGVFENDRRGLRQIRSPRVCDPAGLARRLPARARLITESPRASTVAGLGVLKFMKGATVDADRVVPLYVRRPAAVEKRMKR